MAARKMIIGKKLITPKGRLSFFSLFSPDTRGDSPDGKYKATILFDKNDPEVIAALKVMKKECQRIGAETFGADAKFELHFKDGNEKAEKYPDYKEHIYISAKTKARPQVVGPDLKNLEDGDLYAGCWVRASLTPFAYDQKGNRGVSFWLGNVQKIKDGEAFGGGRSNPEDDFEVLESQVEDAGSTDSEEDVPFQLASYASSIDQKKYFGLVFRGKKPRGQQSTR